MKDLKGVQDDSRSEENKHRATISGHDFSEICLLIYVFYQLTLIHADLVPSLPLRYSCDGLGIGQIMSILHARWVCPRFCWQNLSPIFQLDFCCCMFSIFSWSKPL
jgi:hypothetical protein